jgi:hypothetical protein
MRFFPCTDIARLIIAKNKLVGGLPDLNLLLQCEPRRQSCLKIDWFAGDGVVELQKSGVQEISSIAREAGEIFERLAG